MNSLSDLIAFLSDPNQLWATSETDLLLMRMAAHAYDGPVLEAKAPGSSMQTRGRVAVLNISGPIAYKPSFFTALFGGSAVLEIQQAFRAAMQDDSISSVLLALDTPGGTVSGVPELAEEIRAASKPVIAQVSPLAASAGYWLASGAKEIAITPSGRAGNIGIVYPHTDISDAMKATGIKTTLITAGKFKGEASPYEPLSDEARAHLQADVDGMYSQFVKAVADGRGATQTAVREGYGEGRALFAAAAIKAGLVDRMSTLDQTLGRMTGGSLQRVALAAEETRVPDSLIRAQFDYDLTDLETSLRKPPCR
jgi:signal peptide peptidase SppA